MADGAVSTTTGGMQAAAAQFVTTYDVIVMQMQDLRNKLTQLRHEWDGQAAQIFEKTMIEWGQEFDNITKHLDEMADLLIGGAGHMTRAEDVAIEKGQFFKV